MERKIVHELSRRRHFFGLFLLFIVNVCWVAAAEISRFIFIDLNFKRPFLMTYTKLCMLTIYMMRYFFKKQCSRKANEETRYDKLVNVSDGDAGEIESLTPAEFEQVTMSEESDFERISDAARKVRFAQIREVRHMPVSLADDALRARLPYAATDCLCKCSSISSQFKYSIVLSAMWIICTLSYQASLLFLSVSSVNLISASSSLLVLLFSSICAFSSSDRFTIAKFLLVLCNLIGVGLVSEYSVSLYGTSLALFSALCYALYLVYFSYCQSVGFTIEMNFMFGMVGVLTITVYSPLLLWLDYASIEKLFPLPDGKQLSMLMLNGIVGTVFSDYLWLHATGLTSSLAASISLSLSIPLSLLADTVFHAQSPSVIQLIAAVPITISFIGAAFLRSTSDMKIDVDMVSSSSSSLNCEEGLSLIDEDSLEDDQRL